MFSSEFREIFQNKGSSIYYVPKFSEKLAFFTLWQAHERVRIKA